MIPNDNGLDRKDDRTAAGEPAARLVGGGSRAGAPQAQLGRDREGYIRSVKEDRFASSPSLFHCQDEILGVSYSGQTCPRDDVKMPVEFFHSSRRIAAWKN